MPRSMWFGRHAHVLDAAVVLWCAAWIWMGLAVAQDIRGLVALSDTVSSVGRAAAETGRTLTALGEVPLVGDRIGPAASTITEAGESAAESGRTSRAAVRRTSVLLGLSIALIPTLPVALAYVPRRLAAHRRRGELLDALRHGRREDVEPYLAIRAVLTLPLDDLPRRGDRALADLFAGRYRELADAELHSLGLDPERSSSGGR